VLAAVVLAVLVLVLDGGDDVDRSGDGRGDTAGDTAGDTGDTGDPGDPGDPGDTAPDADTPEGPDTAGDPDATEAPDAGTMTPTVDVDLDLPVFPDPLTARRFDDPRAAVRAFATEVVGMADPRLGELRQADTRSGEVDVQPVLDGPSTVVAVRRLADDTWFVTGARSPDLELDRPAPGEVLTTPIPVSGRARSAGGTVRVVVLADGVGQVGEAEIGAGTGPELSPLATTVQAQVPEGADHGAVVVITRGGQDPSPWTAVAVRIRFAGDVGG
jgi:hypothetical protein